MPFDATPESSSEIRTGAVIRLYLGQEPFEKTDIGDGYRLLVVASVGRKWVELLDPATLRHLRALQRDVEGARPEIMDISAKRIERRIRRKAREFRRLKVGYSKRIVGDALAAFTTSDERKEN